MTQYNAAFPMKQLFPPQVPANVLAEAIAAANQKQCHVAETEKYAHVTFFFNGGQERQFEGEERVMVPSPKDVPTYDLKPEMNAAGVADEVIKAIESGSYPFVMCNFAPPDMVGHTGQYKPTILACQATDTAIGRIQEVCEAKGYTLLVTSDHGNAEQMISPQGGPHTAHTTNRVPFYMFDPQSKFQWKKTTRNTTLQDVAPTVLELLGIKVPEEMEGESLLEIAA
jgi:2,3-bisphosphoglycerate-independent phosphoglycerate mutase